MNETQLVFLAAIAAAFFVAVAIGRLVRNRLSEERENSILEREKLESKNYAALAADYKNAKRKLERSHSLRGTRVIPIIHDISDGFIGRDGLPKRISFEEAFEVVEQIRTTRNAPIAIVLHTMGGYTFPTEMIAGALKAHTGHKVAYVPYIAMSGGTVIALATEKVFMGKGAALGPIDTQYFGPWPADAFKRLLEEKPKDKISDEVLMASYVVEKYEQTARERACKLLHPNHHRKNPACKVTDQLINGGLSHGERITAKDATDLGITVSNECPPEVYQLVDTRLRMLKKADEKKASDADAKPPQINALTGLFRND